MSNSPLVNVVRISPNKTSPRRHAIDRITIHMTVGQLTPETLGEIFARPARKASSNYGIGYDGRVGMYVEEMDRAWTSSSGENDHQAVTIEVSSETFSPYTVTDDAFRKLLDLVEDICIRNGKKKLLWISNREKALNYKPADDEMILTIHRWFASTLCPGAYLLSRHAEIAQTVTERIKEEMDYEDFKKCMTRYEAEQKDLPADSWAVDSLDWAVENGIMEGDGHGNLMPMANVTREQFATMLHRYADKLTGKA